MASYSQNLLSHFLNVDLDLDGNNDIPHLALAAAPLHFYSPVKVEDSNGDTDDWDDQDSAAHYTMADDSRSASPEHQSNQQQRHPVAQGLVAPTQGVAHPSVAALNPASLYARAASPPVLPNGNNLSGVFQPAKKDALAHPHPYAISPTNTTALFTRASSVSSNTAGKKSRAPPSGPISVKDFVPPDVSGLSKREARLVKNRAAAFLSRQRKREEFEGLETRVEILQNENKRLHDELQAYRSGNAPATDAYSPASSSNDTVLTAEIAGLRRQLASRDQELAKLHTRIRALVAAQEDSSKVLAERNSEIAELSASLAKIKRNPLHHDEESLDETDSDRSTPALEGGNPGASPSKGASMAVMALLMSLSTLLGSGSGDASAPAAPSSTSFQNTLNDFEFKLEPLSPTPSFPAASGLGLGFGLTHGLSDASAFASLAYSAAGPSSSAGVRAPAAPATTSAVTSDVVAKAISGVKSISSTEFEFDYAVDSGKKVKVSVKSPFPLDVAFPASSGASVKQPSPSTSSKTMFGDEDDLLSPWGELASPGSRKRKHGETSYEPSPSQRRRLSEQDELMFSSEFDLLQQQEEDSKDWFLNLPEMDDIVMRN